MIINPYLFGVDNLNSITMVGRYETWREPVVSDGTAQSQATDFSGSTNNLLQASGPAQPLYKTAIVNGQPVWRFDGSNDFFMSASISAMNNIATRWYYCVYAFNSLPGVARVAYAGDNTGNSVGTADLGIWNGVSSDNQRYIFSTTGFDDQSSANLGVGVFRVVSMNIDGTNVVRKWGPGVTNSVAQSSPPSNGTFKMMMAAVSQASPTLFASIDIAALFIGNSVLTTLEKSRIESYMTRIFGVSP